MNLDDKKNIVLHHWFANEKCSIDSECEAINWSFIVSFYRGSCIFYDNLDVLYALFICGELLEFVQPLGMGIKFKYFRIFVLKMRSASKPENLALHIIF